MDSGKRCTINAPSRAFIPYGNREALVQANGNYIFYQVMYQSGVRESNDLRRLDSRTCENRSLLGSFGNNGALSRPLKLELGGDRKLRLANDKGDLFVIGIDGQAAKQLNNPDQNKFKLQRSEYFLSQEGRLFFVARSSLASGLAADLIYIGDDGKNARKLNPGGTLFLEQNSPLFDKELDDFWSRRVHFSTDKRWLYFTALREGDDGISVFKYDLQENGRTELATNLDITVLNDWQLLESSGLLLLEGSNNSKASLFAVSTTNGDAKQITGQLKENVDGATVFSRIDSIGRWLVTDTGKVVYAGRSGEGRSDIFSVNLDGSFAEQLTSPSTIPEQIVSFGWFDETLLIKAKGSIGKSFIYEISNGQTGFLKGVKKPYTDIVQLNKDEVLLIDNQDDRSFIENLTVSTKKSAGLLESVGTSTESAELRSDGSYTLFWHKLEQQALNASVFNWRVPQEVQNDKKL